MTVGSIVGLAVGDTVGMFVGVHVSWIKVGFPVGRVVGCSVVGDAVVGFVVGTNVGGRVDSVGVLVGMFVGLFEGLTVGVKVSDKVGEEVGSAVGTFVSLSSSPLTTTGPGSSVGDRVSLSSGLRVGIGVGFTVGSEVEGDVVGLDVDGLDVVGSAVGALDGATVGGLVGRTSMFAVGGSALGTLVMSSPSEAELGNNGTGSRVGARNSSPSNKGKGLCVGLPAIAAIGAPVWDSFFSNVVGRVVGVLVGTGVGLPEGDAVVLTAVGRVVGVFVGTWVGFLDGDPVGITVVGLMVGAFVTGVPDGTLVGARSCGVAFGVGDEVDPVGSARVGADVGRGATVGGSFFLGLYGRSGSSESVKEVGLCVTGDLVSVVGDDDGVLSVLKRSRLRCLMILPVGQENTSILRSFFIFEQG